MSLRFERALPLIVLIVGLSAGCSERRRVSGTPRFGADAAVKDSGPGDGGGADTGTEDGGVPGDSGTFTDAGFVDSGTPDFGTPDTGAPDTGTPDTGTPDFGTPDTGTPDTGTPDTGTPDGGTGMGACTNAADLMIIQTVDVEGEAATCGFGCISAMDRVMCGTDCVSMNTGLSQACSMCFAEAIDCTIANCLTSCIDPMAPACEQCQMTAGCRTAFYACSGL